MHHIRGPLVAAPSAGGRRRRRRRGRWQGRRHGGRRRQLAANVGCFIVEWPSRRGVLGGDVRPAQCPARAAAEFVAVEVVGRPLAQAGSPTLRSQGRARPCTRTAGRRTLRKPAAPVAEAARLAVRARASCRPRSRNSPSSRSRGPPSRRSCAKGFARDTCGTLAFTL